MSDRYRITVEIDTVDAGVMWMLVPGVSHAIRVHNLAALDAEKLPPPARPVRKGDEIVVTWHGGGSYRCVFVASNQGWLYTSDDGGIPQDPSKHDDCSVTHADGAPISWEDSE